MGAGNVQVVNMNENNVKLGQAVDRYFNLYFNLLLLMFIPSLPPLLFSGVFLLKILFFILNFFSIKYLFYIYFKNSKKLFF